MPYRALALALTLLAIAPATASAQRDRTKPTKPTNLRVTAVTAGSVALAWNPSTDNSGTFTYRVREGLFAEYTVPQTQTTFTWSGLQPSSTYRFVVYAVDGSGNRSDNSNQVTVTTPAAVTPGVPANLRVTGATPNTLSFAWDAAPNAARYQLHSNVAGTHSTTATSYTVHWLQPDTAYTFTVRAVNATGTMSAPSAPITGRTLRDTTAPSVPVVTGFAYSPSEVQLNWSASTDDSNYVSYNVNLDGKPWPHMLPGDNTTMSVRNLRDGTAYTFSVRAYDGSGNFSDEAHITLATPEKTGDTVAPPPPVDLTPSQITSHSVELAWGPWTGHPDNFAHEIHMDGEYLQEVAGDWRYSGMLLPFSQVRHLQPGSTHTFTVHNRDEAGNVSGPSNAVTVTFPPSSDTTPPPAMTALSGDTSPNCAFAFFTFTGSPGEAGDIEIFEDGHFAGVYREEAFMTSFGRRTYTARYVDRAGNSSADSPPTTLDHGMRC